MAEARKIFGTDGIRALAGESPLTVPEIQRIGFAAGAYLKSKSHRSGGRVLLGRDTRESGSWIEKSLIQGLNAGGCQVLVCGVIPTSAVAALLRGKGFLGGVVLSASHNPPQFNGIKFFSSDGKKVPELWEREIEKVLGSLNGTDLNFKDQPESDPYPESVSDYETFIRNALPAHFSLQGIRWAMDCANGSASRVAPELFRSYGASLKVIHADPDGKNINLRCGALHMESLRQSVLETRSFGGCAFDGDADRVLFLDEEGEIMDGDVLLWIVARFLKEKGMLRNDCVVTTVMANLGFFKEMKALGIRALTTPVGDRSVSEAIESSGARVGGEQSGHIIFGDHLSTGDGLLTALKILSIVLEKGEKLSYYRKSFPKSPQVLMNLKVCEKVPLSDCPLVQESISTAQSELGEEGRVFVRYSGTEPLLRVMVEGSSLSQIQRIGQNILDAAERSGLKYEKK